MLFLLLACAPWEESSPPEPVSWPVAGPTTPPSRVILLILDGVRVEECVGDGEHPSLTGEDPSAFTPEMHATFFPQAAIVHGASNLGVTTTYDAHIELISGLRQPLATLPAVNGSLWRSKAPTLFEMLRQQEGLAEEQTLLLANSPLVEDLNWSLWPGLGPSRAAHWNFHTDPEGQDLKDPEVVEELKEWLSTHDTRLALVNLHQMDLAGHVGPDLSYLDRIRSADGAVARFWTWLQKEPSYADHTTLIVLSDHGRHRGTDAEIWRAHGDQCSGCRDLLLMMAGPGILPGEYHLSSTLADVSATAAYALGLPLPLGRGRPLTEVYGLPPSPDDAPGTLAAAGATYAREVGSSLEGALSPTSGLHAEAPVLLQTPEGLLGCWRELPPSGTWTVRCALNGEDTGFPPGEGAANWSGRLLGSVGGSYLAWVHNPEGYAGASLVRPRLAFLNGDGWHTDPKAPPELTYPANLSLSRTPSESVRLATVSSDDEAAGRSSRSITVYDITSGDNGDHQRWQQVLRVRPDATFPLLDDPALRPDGAALAWLGITPTGSAAVMLQNGLSGTPEVLSYGAIPLLGLHWRDVPGSPSLFWAQPGPEGIQIFRWDGSLHAYPTSHPWIAGIAVTETSVLLSTPTGVEVLSE